MNMDQSQEPRKESREENEGELLHVKPPVTCKRDEHYFIRTGSLEASCTKCPIGFVLNVNCDIKEGKLYVNGTMVI